MKNIMKLKKSMEELADGERLEIVATDAGFPRDAEAWCQTCLLYTSLPAFLPSGSSESGGLFLSDGL